MRESKGRESEQLQEEKRKKVDEQKKDEWINRNKWEKWESEGVK